MALRHRGQIHRRWPVVLPDLSRGDAAVNEVPIDIAAVTTPDLRAELDGARAAYVLYLGMRRVEIVVFDGVIAVSGAGYGGASAWVETTSVDVAVAETC